MVTIILGVVVFVVVIVALVVVLMIAKSKLVASADVTITINDDPDKAIVAPAGDTLLNTLGAKKIFIPSACGGKGTCGVCKVAGPRGRRRPAAHRDLAHQPRRGARRRPPVVPGQGQAGHEDRDRSRDLQRPQVDVPGAFQPQRGDLHQGAGPRAARGRGGPVPRRRLHPDRMPAARGQLQGLRHRGGVPRRTGTSTTCGSTSPRWTKP